MLDTKIYNPEKETVRTSKETIIERTITPDKVTDMYDRVKQEVISSIIKQYKPKDTLIDGMITEVRNDYLNSSKEIFAKFVINGKDVVFKFETRQFEEPQNVFETAFKELSKHISQEIFDRHIKIKLIESYPQK